MHESQNGGKINPFKQPQEAQPQEMASDYEEVSSYYYDEDDFGKTDAVVMRPG